MNLPVLPTSDRPTWYADGLDFTCTTCGNCCTGGPGFVFVTDEEIALAADHLKVSVSAFKKSYCRKVLGKVSFKEIRRPSGLHDCVFLTEIPAQRSENSTGELEPGQPIPLPRRVCRIYPVRPLQCRTWPFWEDNLLSKAAWNRAAKGCPGMNRDGRHFSPEQIAKIRDAAEWPVNPPASARGDQAIETTTTP